MIRTPPSPSTRSSAVSPGYFVDLLQGQAPRDRDDIDEWMVRGPLSRTVPLLYEARHLLDEPGLRDRAPYLSTLATIASGATTNAQVAARAAT